MERGPGSPPLRGRVAIEQLEWLAATHLEGANLLKADLRNALIIEAHFDYAMLAYADLRGAVFMNSSDLRALTSREPTSGMRGASPWPILRTHYSTYLHGGPPTSIAFAAGVHVQRSGQ
jgi:hypothetical protein